MHIYFQNLQGEKKIIIHTHPLLLCSTHTSFLHDTIQKLQNRPSNIQELQRNTLGKARTVVARGFHAPLQLAARGFTCHHEENAMRQWDLERLHPFFPSLPAVRTNVTYKRKATQASRFILFFIFIYVLGSPFLLLRRRFCRKENPLLWWP